MPDRECAACGATFTPRRITDKTCKLECQLQHRRRLNREKARRHYQPRPPRPDAACTGCGVRIPAPKTGPMPKWCSPCRASREDVRVMKRYVGGMRECHKCGTPVVEARGKPGLAVCFDCRVDPRTTGPIREAARRLRKYGITQEQYSQLLEDQGGRCPACSTGDPGAKGWCIDHDHRTGRVRALLCMRCNTTVGLAGEDPAVLRSIADWLERQHTAQVG